MLDPRRGASRAARELSLDPARGKSVGEEGRRTSP
jgi:hypothetical protein